MSKASRSRTSPNSGGAVTVIEVSTARSFARRAQVTFYVVAFFGLMVGIVAAMFAAPDRRVLAVGVGLVIGLVLAALAAALVTAWPVLRSLWHWSLEIGSAVAVVFGWTALADATAPWVPGVALAAIAAAIATAGPIRRRLVAIAWCAVVRHRLRLSFAEFVRAVNRLHLANPPLILLARPTPAGERVWVWLRPGLDLTDLEEKADKLAVACWASEVRAVRASARFAALVRIDVTRRDPLARLVASPLAAMVPGQRDSDTTAGRADWAGLDLNDVPEELPEPQARGRR
jgi:hypothetical protein